MPKLIISRKRMTGNFLLIAVIFVAQLLGTSLSQSNTIKNSLEDFTNEEIIEQIKAATSSIASLFNEKEGIFLWNYQNPFNLSRYGDLGDLTNGDEGLQELDLETWLNGLSHDIEIQFLILKKNVNIALEFVGSNHEEYLFNRQWIFMTERIVNWLYYNIAINDQIIHIMNSMTPNRNGFSTFWNTFIRPLDNNFVLDRLSLLCDTMVLGSKILKAVEFMPYYTYYESASISLISEAVNNWWSAINSYALHDPKFAVAGIGDSGIDVDYNKWVGWAAFNQMANNDSFVIADVFTDDYIDFQNYLYTSPQIASEYLMYIKKLSSPNSFAWNPSSFNVYPVSDPILAEVTEKITNNYALHIGMIYDSVVYVHNPSNGVSWSALEQKYSGYTYMWQKYFIDKQDSETDLIQYQTEIAPLKISNMRTFQGAGDIPGLIDIYKLLSHSFIRDSELQITERNAFSLVNEIIKSQREDNSFVFSPYFGTALDESIIAEPLINDADLVLPEILPEGLRTFKGSMFVMEFLLQVKKDLAIFAPNDDMAVLKERVDNTLTSLADLLLENIDQSTSGISKNSIVGNNLIDCGGSHFYAICDVFVTVDLSEIYASIDDIPDWMDQFDVYTGLGRSKIYQWDYLYLLNDLFLLNDDKNLLDPLIQSLLLFQADLLDDDQYQLSAICEGKDAIAKTFFSEHLVEDSVVLNDKTGFFTNNIPFNYREEIFPVTHAFSIETPQRISALVLNVLPAFLEPLLNNPINQAVIVGFITGIIMTVAVVYVRRPRYQ
ncbi:MAG: hypothetical protein KGD59_14530 [Candidatus Heimdallarchaeota archaeon]|nr:hypothetical protein [Candidatus Heimdallarchaeota archaeon]MBY8995764.1 hypothetical protein [Candidatus Heimdallarchaeota archaeon]